MVYLFYIPHQYMEAFSYSPFYVDHFPSAPWTGQNAVCLILLTSNAALSMSIAIIFVWCGLLTTKVVSLTLGNTNKFNTQLLKNNQYFTCFFELSVSPSIELNFEIFVRNKIKSCRRSWWIYLNRGRHFPPRNHMQGPPLLLKLEAIYLSLDCTVCSAEK